MYCGMFLVGICSGNREYLSRTPIKSVDYRMKANFPQAVNYKKNHLKIKTMLIVLEVAAFLAVIVLPLIPAKKVAK